MAITLNGIAQGFATDAAMRVVKAHGVEHALIDAGELSAAGRNLDGIQRHRPTAARHGITQTPFAEQRVAACLRA
jgi:thiamine biosynthesis lipoprotein ApbE